MAPVLAPGSRSRRIRRPASALIAATVLLLGAGCQVETEVAVEAREGGDGRVRVTVALDQAAAREVPDLVRDLRVDDIRQAGWAVEGPYPTRSGGAEVRATKSFDSPAALASVVEEVGGPGGPFQGFRLDVEESALRTRTAFRGTLDLAGGLEAFSDPVLTEKLGGQPLGVPLENLEKRAGVPLDRVFVFRVVSSLPGRARANTPSVAGGTATWTARLGERVDLVADAELLRPRPQRAAALAAAVLGVVAVGAAAVAASRTRRRRRRAARPPG